MQVAWMRWLGVVPVGISHIDALKREAISVVIGEQSARTGKAFVVLDDGARRRTVRIGLHP